MPTLGDVRERLEAYYGTRVPVSLARLLNVLLRDEERAQRFLEATGFSVEDAIEPAVIECAARLPSRQTFRYLTQPPELLVFAKTGTDGEQMGLLQLAEELPFDELPVVGFFPMQFGAETFALGDDLESGICAVMSTYERDPAEIPPLSLPEVFAHPLHPAPRPSYVPYVPPEREGYRFEMTIDHVGVFAPADGFAGEEVHVTAPPKPAFEPELERALALAERFLASGVPASAMVLAREVRAVGSPTTSLTYSGNELIASHDEMPHTHGRSLELWREAAAQLGRPWLAAMVAEL